MRSLVEISCFHIKLYYLVKVFKFSDNIVYTHIYTTFSNGNFQTWPFTTEVSSLFRSTNWDLQALSNALVLLHTKLKNTRVLEQKVDTLYGRELGNKRLKETLTKSLARNLVLNQKVSKFLFQNSISSWLPSFFLGTLLFKIFGIFKIFDKVRGHTLLNLRHSSV